MTSYVLFAGLGTLIYVGVALAQTTIAGFGDAHIAFWPCAAACSEWHKTIAGEEALTSADRSQSPHVEPIHIPRTGQINTWDNPKWVEAIQKTGRKTLLIAATLTSVCLSFPTLSALATPWSLLTRWSITSCPTIAC